MKNKYKRLAAILCTSLLCGMLVSAQAAESAEPKAALRTVVKVGFPLQKGLAQQDENGQLSGYTYDYLQEIAQFTGWDYEYKVIDGTDNEAILDMMDMLEKGEIDVMGGMLISEELAKTYRYSNFDYLSRYDGLFVPNAFSYINEMNYASFSPLRVAVYGTATQAAMRLDKFAGDLKLDIEKVYCKTLAEQKQKVNAGEADALWTINIGMPEGMHPVAKAYREPAYFAFAPNKGQLALEMDAAMMKLSKASPQLEVKLETKYLASDTKKFTMTSEEKAYVSSAKAINVMGLDYSTPGLWYDKKNNVYAGVAVEILNIVSEKTGLDFVYGTQKDRQSLSRALSAGECDIIAQTQYDYSMAKDGGFVLSRPYVITESLALENKAYSGKSSGGIAVALPQGLVYENKLGGEIIYYSSMKECMDAVQEGKARFAVGSNYDIQFNLAIEEYDMLTTLRQEGNIELCFGISKQADENLLNIINKTIYSIPQNELSYIINTNMNAEGYLEDIRQTKLLSNSQQIQLLTVLLVIAAIIALIALIAAHRARKATAHANLGYSKLCDAAGEYLIHYDFAKDKLDLSENAARDFVLLRVEEIFHDYKQKTAANAQQVSANSDSGEGCEVCMRIANGDKAWFRYYRYSDFDRRGREVGCTVKFINITAEKEEQEALTKRNREDALTALSNAVYMRKQAQAYLDTGEGKCAMILADINDFKRFNDIYGHIIGDYALMQLSELLRSNSPPAALLARYSGDVFMIFIKQASTKDAREFCEAVCACARQMIINSEQRPIEFNMSAVCANMAHSFDEMYELATKELELIKAKSKANISVVEL